MSNPMQDIIDSLKFDTDQDLDNSGREIFSRLTDPQWVKDNNPDLSILYTTLSNNPALGEKVWGHFQTMTDTTAKEPGDIIACCCSSGGGQRPGNF